MFYDITKSKNLNVILLFVTVRNKSIVPLFQSYDFDYYPTVTTSDDSKSLVIKHNRWR